MTARHAVWGAAYLEVTSAVLCPACSGDWCSACNFTGRALPADSPAAAGGGSASAAGVLPLIAAVDRWVDTNLPRRAAA